MLLLAALSADIVYGCRGLPLGTVVVMFSNAPWGPVFISHRYEAGAGTGGVMLKAVVRLPGQTDTGFSASRIFGSSSTLRVAAGRAALEQWASFTVAL